MKKSALASVLSLVALAGCQTSSPSGRPRVVLRPAEPFQLPGVSDPKLQDREGGIDCNNAAHWDGDTLYLFSSWGSPYRSEGKHLFELRRPSTLAPFDNNEGYNGGRWIESTYKDEKTGLLYGWYHREPGGVCEGKKTAPRIGAAVSDDNGAHWQDLDTVLDPLPESFDCETVNHYFAGGNGDFSVILDRPKKYFYFLISTYNKDVAEQGVSVARMRYEDRDAPIGKVWKWHNGDWKEPGIGGRVTPLFPAKISWHTENPDVFWGASIHWNTHLNMYVILMNRAKDKNWGQEGTYITFNRDIANCSGWSEPQKIYDGGAWYPQVIGTSVAKRETDKLAGPSARFFLRGKSEWEIVFLRPGEQVDNK